MNWRRTLLLASVIVVTIGVVSFTGTVSAATEEQEPNDEFETAQSISEGNISGEIFDGESDFYEIQANTTDAIRVNVENAPQPDDLALRVYNDDREQILADGFAEPPGPLTTKVPATGTYYIEVVGTTQQKTTEYTLDYDKITPAENDPFAPNSNFSAAVSLNEGFADAKIWGGESDFYEIQANTTDAIRVNVENAPQPDDLALRVYNGDREQILADDFAEPPGPLTTKVPATGTYYVEVVGTAQQKTTEYTLDYDKITPAENDPFAPNSNFSAAVSLNEGFTDAKIWGGESDFYEIQANTTDAIRVNVENAPQPDDLALRVYNDDREQILADGFAEPPGPLTTKVPATGTYYIEVVGTTQQKTTEYTLDYDKITPAENDPFAPNSNFSAAVSLNEGFTDAKIWGGESDFYEIQANTTDAVRVNVENAPQPDDLALRVYNGDREQILADGFAEPPGPLTTKVPATGTYYVEVVGTTQQKTTEYTLDYDKITPAENDPFAPNSNFSTSSLLTQRFTDGKIWGGESDFYRVALTSNQTVEVNVEDAPQPDDLALRVYNDDREQILGDGFGDPPGPLTTKVPETGTYYIEVDGTTTQKTTGYTLDSNRTNNDSDGDTIPDVIDEAPNQPEDFDGCEDEDGAPDDYICPLASDPPQDTDNDGRYEDADGDGTRDLTDVQTLFDNLGSPTLEANADAFKFSETGGEVTVLDVQALFNELPE